MTAPPVSTAPDCWAVLANDSTNSHVWGQASNAQTEDRNARLALAAAVLGLFVVLLDAVPALFLPTTKEHP